MKKLLVIFAFLTLNIYSQTPVQSFLTPLNVVDATANFKAKVPNGTIVYYGLTQYKAISDLGTGYTFNSALSGGKLEPFPYQSQLPVGTTSQTWDATGALVPLGGGSSQWDNVTRGINYSGGLVGINNPRPDAPLDIFGVNWDGYDAINIYDTVSNGFAISINSRGKNSKGIVSSVLYSTSVAGLFTGPANAIALQTYGKNYLQNTPTMTTTPTNCYVSDNDTLKLFPVGAMPVTDTITPVLGQIVYKSSDNHFYGCRSTTGHKWFRLDN